MTKKRNPEISPSPLHLVLILLTKKLVMILENVILISIDGNYLRSPNKIHYRKKGSHFFTSVSFFTVRKLSPLFSFLSKSFSFFSQHDTMKDSLKKLLPIFPSEQNNSCMSSKKYKLSKGQEKIQKTFAS